MRRLALVFLLTIWPSACTATNVSLDPELNDAPLSRQSAGNTQPSSPVGTPPTEPSPGTIPFHLSVTNEQSFKGPEVRLLFWLDEVLVIDDEFQADQHDVVSYDFHLKPGDHEIRVLEVMTGVEIFRTFTLRDESWALVAHWGHGENGPQLNWQFSQDELWFG